MGTIISRVRQARLTYAAQIGRDVSVAEVARAIGVSRAALHKIEKGAGSVSHSVLAALCKFYSLQPGDLLKYEEAG